MADLIFSCRIFYLRKGRYRGLY